MRYIIYILLLMTSVLGLSLSNALARDLSPSTVRQLMRAYELQQQEQLTQAIAALEQINTASAYDKAHVNQMLGGLYWQTSQSAKAITHLALAVDASQLAEAAQKDTSRMLADILLIENAFVRAERRYLRLLSIYQRDEEYAWIWLRVAQSQYGQQKWSAVEQSLLKHQKYRRATKQKPLLASLNMMLRAQLAQNKWQDAITTTTSLRELEPTNFLWWRQLVSLYMQLEQPERALITLQQADRAGLELTREQLRLMAQLYAGSGVPYRAAQTYQRLADINQSSELLAQQARYWQQAKAWDNAQASWKKAAELRADYYQQYAQLSLRLRDYPTALEAIKRVPSPSASTLLLKAQVLNELGQLTQALAAAAEAHRLAPSAHTLSWVKFLTQHSTM